MFALTESGKTIGPAGRFQIEGCLGTGSTGVVYAAWDNERNIRIACKTLRHMDADGIYHLKREFRSLVDVSHKNLVRFYELFGDADKAHWFVTMELVQGVDFTTYVRGDPSFGTLRRAFRQLIEGVEALHRAGKLHRDVKPTNALVTSEGRVVLLDFGLVTDIALTQLFHTLEPKLVGTPAYLSPEQAAGAPLGPGTDFYAAGVMLYEALTGRLPFEGTFLDVLRAKNSPPRHPRTLAPHAPADLCDLCEALLQVRAEDRPGTAQILAQLGAAEPPMQPALAEVGHWVGRTTELVAINEAFETARQGHTVVMFVHGSSGVGKSALLRRALEGIASGDDTVVLAGRCYERELVPYRGLDNVIDALTRYLGRLSDDEAQALVPRDADALTRLFPVLRRVPAFDRPARRAHKADALDERRRAWSSFREMLGRIADRKTLVLCIDDWQWGDEDSARLLLELLQSADVPPLLLLFGHRSEEAQDSSCLRIFAQGLETQGANDVQQRRIELLPFDAADATLLAQGLLGGAHTAAANIAAEAGGNAFFVRALVEHVRTTAPADTAGVTLDHVIQSRVQGLSSDACRLLEILAIAGRPLSCEDANQAAELDPTDLDAAMELRTQHLLRGRGDSYEIDHDRIRMAVVAGLPPQVQKHHHGRLLATLHARPGSDPEIVGSHLLAMGETLQAAEAFFTAGTQAEDALAFARAARLFTRATELAGASWPKMSVAHEHLGDALSNLGQGAAAAASYLQAAPSAAFAKALDLRRKAAEQNLRIGHLEQGLATLKVVLSGIGEKLASSSHRALVSLVIRRAFIRMRGLRYRERAEGEISPDSLVRLDVFWSASTALGIIDNVRATDLQTRHLRLALRLGEPYRIARALASEVGYSAVRGTAASARTARLVAAAGAAAARVSEPFAHGWATLAAGMAKYLEAQHVEAHRLCEEAEATFEGCVGVWWEMGSARLFGAWSLYYLGGWATLAQRMPVQIAQAEARGDLYTATSFASSVLCIRWLMSDDVEAGRTSLGALLARWPRAEFHALHYWHMVADCMFALYSEQGDLAWDRLLRDEQPLRKALLLRVQTVRVEFAELQGRCLLVRAMATADAAGRATLLKRVAKIAMRLTHEASPWSRALAMGLLAGIDATRSVAAGVSGYTKAARAFEQANMLAHAAAAWCRGAECAAQSQPNAWTAADAAVASHSEGWFLSQGVKHPLRMAKLLAPGGQPLLPPKLK